MTDALRTLLRDFHADAFPESGSGGKPGEITLQLHVDPESDWALSFSPDLAEQLMHQFEDAEAGSDQFVDGAVFNFHAESNDHPLCRPPSTTEVFAGYNSLGQPQWKELAQVLIDHKDERVDRLYAKGGPVVCLIQRGKELKQELLTSFGKSSKTFSLLGQVVAGYVRIPAGIPLPPGTPNRAAITFQIVETRGRGGDFRVALNTVVGGLTPDQRAELLASSELSGVYRAREVAQRSLKEISRDAAAARAQRDMKRFHEVMRRVGRVERALAASLERDRRQNNRRTKHADQRRKDPARAAHKAQEDARAASDDQWFLDQRHKTLVVCTDKGRAHAFSPEGKHVTSFRLNAEGVAFRVRTDRFTPAEQNALTALRAAMGAGSDAKG